MTTGMAHKYKGESSVTLNRTGTYHRKFPLHQITWKSVQQFYSSSPQTDKIGSEGKLWFQEFILFSMFVGIPSAAESALREGRQRKLNTEARSWLLQWKSNTYCIFWVYVCSLAYPARNAHAPLLYYHVWPVWLYHIFPCYLINGMIFWGKKGNRT